MATDFESQEDELTALQSIYGDCLKREQKGGKMVINFQLQRAKILILDCGSSKSETSEIKLQYFPPLILQFNFLENYPSREPPDFKLQSVWIPDSKLNKIRTEMHNLWRENKDSIIYSWIEHIKETIENWLDTSDTLKMSNFKQVSNVKIIEENYLDTTTENVSKMAVVASGSKTNSNVEAFNEVDVLDILINFNTQASLKKYETESYECMVCFEYRLGKHSIKFWPCDHIFCKNCMKPYFEIKMKEEILEMKCPAPKCESQAHPKQIEELVSKELYDKWDSLVLHSAISSLWDTQPCPRLHCQYPVTMDGDEGACPECGYVFCGICRNVWHGIEDCFDSEEDVEKVVAKIYSENSSGEDHSDHEMKIKENLSRMRREIMKGKKKNKIQQSSNSKEKKMKARHLAEEVKTRKFLKSLQRCPACDTMCEKAYGCNSVNCFICFTHFCFCCQSTKAIHP